VLANLEAMKSKKFADEFLGGMLTGEIDMDKINTQGGSLSIGHPFGATGGRLVTTAANRMVSEFFQRICIYCFHVNSHVLMPESIARFAARASTHFLPHVLILASHIHAFLSAGQSNSIRLSEFDGAVNCHCQAPSSCPCVVALL
jgi:hypothetical protein